MSTQSDPIRVFVDSNVLIEGLFAPWSASRAILILARAGVFRLLLSPYVEAEVERALLNRLSREPEEGSRLIEDYDLALRLLAPERTPRITREEFNAHRALIRHQNDVPVLVTAIRSQPDWLVTSNTEHFTSEVAVRTGLRIVTPQEFLTRCGIRLPE
ncbi:MAG TPA: PIN domain-containing protein [Blastocatellia bacterium]|nr:PIN domain-containing protein [Blastocatellia bacterium]